MANITMAKIVTMSAETYDKIVGFRPYTIAGKQYRVVLPSATSEPVPFDEVIKDDNFAKNNLTWGIRNDKAFPVCATQI